MKLKLTLAAAALAVLILWLIWGNTALELSRWVIEDEKIPHVFDGFRIAQVSDLHNTPIWEDAVHALEEAKPDLIVLTGDLIDSRRTDVDAALDFVRAAVKIAPCCYVTGNHESRISQWEQLRLGLMDAGVMVLEDEAHRIERDGESVMLLGLQDPTFGSNQEAILRELTAGEEGFLILLSHRPERLGLYARYGIDLVFSGHAHGGQVRIPFVGGLIAPNQGLFPDYDSGLYQLEETSMLLSRGVGNSIFPLRVNNRPEIILAELKFSTGFLE